VAIYPTDLDHPRTHVVWTKTFALFGGKFTLLAAYKTYPSWAGRALLPKGSAEAKAKFGTSPDQPRTIASVTIATYTATGRSVITPEDVVNYTGAIVAERVFTDKDLTEAEVRAVNWLNENRPDWLEAP